MHLEILVNGRPRLLEMNDGPSETATRECLFDGKPSRADAREVEPGAYSILIDGRSYEVKLEPGADGYHVSVGGRRYAIQVRDPRRLSRSRGFPEAAGRQKIASPMPGKVVRVLVREGEQVAAGQGVLVVEAMKMQNEIRSPKAGRVVALRAAVGAAVAGGETLAEVE